MAIPFDVGGDPVVYPVFPAEDTALNIINDAAVEVGLDVSSGVYASTDPNFILLRTLLKNLGRRLWREYDWSHLQRECTFDTEANQVVENLPGDYGRMIDSTAWNRDSQMPLGGPMRGPEWQMMQARSSTSSLRIGYRIYQGQLYLYPDTGISAGQEIAYEYISKYWVRPSASQSASADAPTADGDYVWFDPHLVKCGLKYEYNKARGFDYSAQEEDFKLALEQCKGDDTPSRTLSLSGNAAEPLISWRNIPSTGIGS